MEAIAALLNESNSEKAELRKRLEESEKLVSRYTSSIENLHAVLEQYEKSKLRFFVVFFTEKFNFSHLKWFLIVVIIIYYNLCNFYEYGVVFIIVVIFLMIAIITLFCLQVMTLFLQQSAS